MKEVRTIRPKFRSAPQIMGSKKNLLLPNGERRQAQYVVVNMDDIIASHDHHTFASSPGFPTDETGHNINDRNYTRDKSAQAAVIGYAQNLEPELLIEYGVREAGTPIVSLDGFVVSGNNRTMSIKLAAEEYPERYQAYKDLLYEDADIFDIDQSELKAFEKAGYKPVLVRYDYDFPEYTTGEMQKFNKGSMKSEKDIDKAIKLSGILSAAKECNEIIANIIGQYETASEFYKVTEDQKRLADTLVKCDILTPQEIVAYYDHGVFTSAGKSFLELLLAAMVLSKDALIASIQPGVKSYRNHIITSLPVLIKNSQLSEGSFKEDLNQAMLLQQKIAESGLGFKDYLAQTSMLDESYSKNAAYLNQLLSKGRNTFKKAIEAYNNEVEDAQKSEGGLFGDLPTPSESFDRHIVKNAVKDNQAIVSMIEHSPKIYADKDQFDTQAAIQKTKQAKSNEVEIARAKIRIKQKLMDLIEKRDWQKLSAQGLSRAYSEDEPDYDLIKKEVEQIKQMDPGPTNRTLLSLFDYTGEWSKPFSDAGWNVIHWDLQLGEEMDINKIADAETALDLFETVDGILAAVPCTDFACSGARWFAEKDKDGRTEMSMELIRQVLRLVDLFTPTDPEYDGTWFWAIENPVGRIGSLFPELNKPYYFNPYEYAGYLNPSQKDLAELQRIREKEGKDITKSEAEFILKMNAYTKKTGLWGDYNIPVKDSIEPVKGSAQGSVLQRYGGKSLKTKNIRSQTPAGFAEAFYHANKNKLFDYDTAVIYMD